MMIKDYMQNQKFDILEKIVCPFCRHRFRIIERLDHGRHFNGILECRCRKYPVTYNILNLGGKYGYALDDAVNYLKKGDIQKAVQVQVEKETLAQSVSAKISRKVFRVTQNYSQMGRFQRFYSPDLLSAASFQDGLSRLKMGGFGMYLKYRYALPSFRAALPVCFLLKPYEFGSILDLGCGAGHYTYVLNSFFPKALYVGVDQHYANLLLGQRFLSLQNSFFICLNLETPIPFSSFFDCIFSSDIVSTLSVSHKNFIKYLALVKTSGVVYLPRFDHCWGKPFTVKPGKKLELRVGMVNHLLSEDGLLDYISTHNDLSLERIKDKQSISDSRALALVLTRDPDFLSLHIDTLWQELKAAIGPWAPDPTYRKSRQGTGWAFKKTGHPALPHMAERMFTIDAFQPTEFALNDVEYDGMHICQNSDALTHLMQGHATVLAPETY